MKIKSLIQLTSAAALFPLAASAATITWDGLGDGINYTDGLNWGGTAPTDDTTTDIAQLTGGSVTLDADRSVNGLDIDSASTLTGSGTRLTVGGSGLTGTADFTLGGTAILQTGTVTTYAGAVNLNGGTVEVTTGDQGFLGTGTITLDGGSIVAAGGSHVNMRDTTNIVLGAGGGTFSNESGRAFYGLDSAIISGAGQLTLDGAGHTNYSGNARIQIASAGANTYTGGTLITNKANVQVNQDYNFGAVTGKVTIDDARIVTENNISFDASREFEIASGGGRISLNNKTSTINGLLSGTGDLTIDGQIRDDDGNNPSGTLIITSSGNTLTGNVTIGENTEVQWGQNSQAIGNDVQVTLDGGTIGAWGNRHLDLGAITNIVLTENGGTLRQQSGRNIYNFNDKVISGAGALTLSGTGGHSGRIQMETTNNTYTGGTIFNEGVLVRLNGNGSLGDAAGSLTFDNGTMQNNNSNVDLGDRAIEIQDGGARWVAGWNDRRISSTGVISGTGKLEVVNDSSVVQLGGSNTYSGGTDVNGTVWTQTGSLGTGDVTLNNSDTTRGHLKNWQGAATHTNNVIIGTDGGTLSGGWNAALTLSGVVSGTGDLRIQGDSGSVVLSNGGNSFNGNIVLEDANSVLSVASLGGGAYSGVISGDAAATFTWTGDGTFTGTNTLANGATVASGGSIGGSGSFVNLTLESGSTFIFSETDTLTVTDTVSLFAGFGVDDIEGLSSATAVGTYMLIDNGGDFSGLDNFGLANAYDLGGGISAYFQNGSLELVVVPEPGTFALLAGMLALGSVMIRRRRS